MMVRASAFEAVGPMDEAFFLYFEETDWCLRARRMGFEVHHLPDVLIEHESGVSALSSGEAIVQRRIQKHYRESRRRYFRKHHGICAEIAVECVHWSRQFVAHRRKLRTQR